MIIVTGAAGFIGSKLVEKLNLENYNDLILVDDFSKKQKEKNYITKTFTQLVEREQFHKWLRKNQRHVQFVFHLGARTDTTEFNVSVFNKLNLDYSKQVWNVCAEFGIPLVYASSAATYGDGQLGYDDKHSLIPELKPLNPYGISKNEFDKWVLQQEKTPSFWAGLKFFNVYGPNEYHKGRMASVIYHAFNQIRETGKLKLFRSHRKDIPDGGQSRDFIYVNDVTDVMLYLLHNRKNSGIYNLGTGKAKTFIELASHIFNALKMAQNIEFIDTPKDIREKYQYFTEAKMSKLRDAGYKKEFTSLDEGISDYWEQYKRYESSMH